MKTGNITLSKLGAGRSVALFLFFAITAIASHAQTFNVLSTFGILNGQNPSGPLAQGFDGNFYGTTQSGGNTGQDAGVVFQVTPSGTLTDIYNFCSQTNCTDGSNPQAGVVLGTDGNFYGTTLGGGGSGYAGTVFKVTPGGVLTTLHRFAGTDGVILFGGLVQATDGNFYGTTYEGGASTLCVAGCGTVFRVTASGTFTLLYNFCTQTGCPDGSGPETALMQASDGNFYGTTPNGGAYGYGTLFRITPAGVLTTIHSFTGHDGVAPDLALIQGAQSNSLYGSTTRGGTHSHGTIFKIAAVGGLTTLYDACPQTGCPDGYWTRGLIQGTDGNFYGTTNGGLGTAYSLSTGLAPFVKTSPSFGKAGASIVIYGGGLTGATAVSFNGTAATFNVLSDTEITAQVPSGATSGRITVTTSNGTLASDVLFRVTQ